MEKLNQERERLRRQIEALQGELRGIERAIALVSNNAADQQAAPIERGRSKNVKETVLTLVQEAQQTGLTVSELIDMAVKRGNHLERGTVSSLLSKFKRDGIFDMTDGRYRFPLKTEVAHPVTH